MTDLFRLGFLTGFVGDYFVQNYTDTDRTGLTYYFQRHGPVESMLLAGALTGFWMWVFQMTRAPRIYIIPYALALDELYRNGYPFLYPSLEGYYKMNTRSETLLYNGIVGTIIYVADQIL